MNRRSSCLILLLLSVVVGCALRLWNLTAGVDAMGLPLANHISTPLMAGWCILSLIVFAIFARHTGGAGNTSSVLQPASGVLSYLGGGLILLSAVLEFASALMTGATMSAPILCLMGVLSGICLLIVCYLRHQEKTVAPPLELIPEVYLVVKLVLNFKSWSTDPIILDYCVLLFAMIFVLLGFYHSTGFLFSQGKPRMTLFVCLGACLFSVMAALDGIMDRSPSAVSEYLGFIFWLLPVISCITAPAPVDHPSS